MIRNVLIPLALITVVTLAACGKQQEAAPVTAPAALAPPVAVEAPKEVGDSCSKDCGKGVTASIQCAAGETPVCDCAAAQNASCQLPAAKATGQP